MRIVGGKYRGKRLATPIHEGTRPTSDRTREMLFNILLHNPAFGPSIILDRAVLDVFAGTGALGLEAISRGAKSVLFIENNRATLPSLYANVKTLGLSPSCVLEKDAQTLGAPPSAFDLIFLDPPYAKNLVQPTLTRLFSQGWIAHGAVVVIEMGKNDSFPMPSFLSPVLERTSGITKIILCLATTNYFNDF
jgi:16S rRNA (guanine966-N2)-methyltransferase